MADSSSTKSSLRYFVKIQRFFRCCILLYKRKSPYLINWFSFLIIIPLFLFIKYVWINIFKVFEIDENIKQLLFYCFLIPALIFSIIILFRKRKSNNNKHKNSENVSNKLNYFTLLISLLTFYATFLIGLFIFIEKPQEGEILYLKDGAIGLRTWNSGVKIYDIKIHYHDSLNRWQQIPSAIIYDSLNWEKVIWNKEKFKEQTTKAAQTNKPNPNSNIIDTLVSLSFKEDSIRLKNCGIVFSPRGDYQRVFRNLRFQCKVKFETINTPVDKLFPGFLILTFIDTCKVLNEYGEREYSDMFLEIKLGANNDHHPWIPALDYKPPIKYVSPVSMMRKYGGFNDIQAEKEYDVSAIIMNNNIFFLGHKNGTVKLFEAKMEDKPDR